MNAPPPGRCPRHWECQLPCAECAAAPIVERVIARRNLKERMRGIFEV